MKHCHFCGGTWNRQTETEHSDVNRPRQVSPRKPETRRPKTQAQAQSPKTPRRSHKAPSEMWPLAQQPLRLSLLLGMTHRNAQGERGPRGAGTSPWRPGRTAWLRLTNRPLHGGGVQKHNHPHELPNRVPFMKIYTEQSMSKQNPSTSSIPTEGREVTRNPATGGQMFSLPT